MTFKVFKGIDNGAIR